MLFNEKNVYGKQIEIKTPVRDGLLQAVSNPASPRRELAAKVLKYYDGIANKQVPTELDRAAQLILAENDCEALWKGWARLETQTGIDGVERDCVIWN